MQSVGSATLLYFYQTDFNTVGDGSPVPNEIAKNLRETERLPYDTSIKTLINYNLSTKNYNCIKPRTFVNNMQGRT